MIEKQLKSYLKELFEKYDKPVIKGNLESLEEIDIKEELTDKFEYNIQLNQLKWNQFVKANNDVNDFSGKMDHHKRFLTFDVETKDGLLGSDLFCCALCYRDKIDNLRNHSKELNVLQSESIDEIMQYLSKHSDKNNLMIIYVHNLSFDVRFIIEWLAVNNVSFFPIISGSNTICLSIDEWNIKFIDSFQFLQTSQDNAEKEWKVPEELTKIDCRQIFDTNFEKWNEVDKQRVLDHNKNDVKALFYIMNNFRKTMFEISNVDLLDVISIASLSMKSFRYLMKEPLINPFFYSGYEVENDELHYICRKYEEKFVRESYYGGRTEVFNMNRIKGLCIDKVSMYPSVMKNNKFPVGIPKWIKDKTEIMKIICDESIDKIAFVECEISNIPEIEKYPCIPEKINGLVHFTAKNKRGIYTSIELRYAFKRNYKIEPIKALVFDETKPIFNEFITKFFEIKSNSEGGKKKCAKIILNSCYGKFGEKYIRSALKIMYMKSESEIEAYIEKFNPSNKLHIRKNEKHKLWIVMERYIDKHIKPYMCVSIASCITAYARIELVKAINEMWDKKQIETYYCDSDSITFESKYENEVKKLIGFGKELGNFDIDKRLDKVQFLAPKCYVYENNGILGLRMKGIENSKRIELCKNSKTLDELILKLREPIELAERFMMLKEAQRNGMFLATKKLSKHYTFSSQKRNFKSDLTSEPIR